MRYNLLEYLRSDIERNKGNAKGTFLVVHYRLANWMNVPGFLRFFFIPYLVWYKFFIEWVLGFEVPSSTRIGKGLLVHHGQGVVVNSNALIGENCCLLHQVTVGTISDGPNAKSPVIGNNVILGVGANILGDVNIGDNSRIGANTLVLKDVCEGSIVVGNPMRVVKE